MAEKEKRFVTSQNDGTVTRSLKSQSLPENLNYLNKINQTSNSGNSSKNQSTTSSFIQSKSDSKDKK